MKPKPEKLKPGTAHYERTPMVLGLVCALLRLQAKKGEKQLPLVLRGKL